MLSLTYISPNEHSPVDDLTHQEAQSGYIVSVAPVTLSTLVVMREFSQQVSVSLFVTGWPTIHCHGA
jgi:hypothetical protein